MAKTSIHGVTIEIIQGDIANQPGTDAVVNAANAQLRIGGGVAGAIHRAAGPGLEEECRKKAPIKPGEAIITGAHNLPNSFVIHCLGPVYGIDNPSDKLLASCYKNAIKLAEEKGIESIAFPAISTGAFGYPFEPAAKIALESVLETLTQLSSVSLIRFVLFSSEEKVIFEQLLNKLKPGETS